MFADDTPLGGVCKLQTSPSGVLKTILVLIALVIAGLLVALTLTPTAASALLDFGIRPGPDTTRVSWETTVTTTTDVAATFLDEADPLTPQDGSLDGIYVSGTPGSGSQRVGVLTWAESVPDSILKTVESATLHLYRVNATDHAGSADSFTVEPVTASWVESQTTWLNRSSRKVWLTAGGMVDPAHGVTVAAGDVPGLDGGAVNGHVMLDVTPVVQAWKDQAVGYYGLRLSWKTGSSPAIRFQANEADVLYRPRLSVVGIRVRHSRMGNYPFGQGGRQIGTHRWP